MTWDDMIFWQSGEWQVVQEKLDDLERAGVACNPERVNLFRALDVLDLERVKVLIVGQDPYPDSRCATGVAFSIPSGVHPFPATLNNILREYVEDLHLEWPPSGNLEQWCKQGVLLWNAIPSCESGKPGSHDWEEWKYLTKEIVELLSKKGIVFCFLGKKAQAFKEYVGPADTDPIFPNHILEFSHPSPRGSIMSKKPFQNSRMFSTINACLAEQGKDAIDWRL